MSTTQTPATSLKPNIDWRIEHTPHSGQIEVLEGIYANPEADVITIVAARGWGKSRFVTCDILLPVLLSAPDLQAQWIAPSYKICKAPIDDVWMGKCEVTGKRIIPDVDPATGFRFFQFHKGEMELSIFNKSRIYFRSADNPDSIVAKGYNIIIVDEAALISREVFETQILATARKRGCKIILITTPRGNNWIKEMYLMGQDKSEKGFLSFKQPWWKRPDYPEVLKRLMKKIPEHIRQQEFEAEFVGAGGSVFRNLMANFYPPAIDFHDENQEWSLPLTPDEKEQGVFLLSIDWAKQSDFTVMFVREMISKKVVHYVRMNKTDYKIQLEKMNALSDQYDAEIVYDGTGVGTGLGDFMSPNQNATGIVFNNENKTEMINQLAVDFEYGNVPVPLITTVKNEFEAFTFSVSRTGKIIYSAPPGFHDDTVISLALNNWYAKQNNIGQDISEINSYLEEVAKVNAPRSRLQELMEEDD